MGPEGGAEPRRSDTDEGGRYEAWFHALDAWTEYWDLYHPETRGRYYFGDGHEEVGLLTEFLPQRGRPRAFTTWSQAALSELDPDLAAAFATEIGVPSVAAAIIEVDDLVHRLFEEHFGSAETESVRLDYLAAMHRFALDTLPPA